MSTTPKTDAFVANLRKRGVEVLTHTQWGGDAGLYRSRVKSKPHSLLPGRPVDTLWNHITVTNDDGRLVGDFKSDCREVERIGKERFGTGVSYNLLVDANGDRPRIAIGQFFEASGAHTQNDKGIAGYSVNQNKVSLAVAWVGVPGDKLNDHAIFTLVQVRAALIETGCLTEGYDDNPHSLVAAKDCPTSELRNRIPALRKAGIAAVKAKPTTTPPKEPAVSLNLQRTKGENDVQYGRQLIAQGVKLLRAAEDRGRPAVGALADAVAEDLRDGVQA